MRAPQLFLRLILIPHNLHHVIEVLSQSFYAIKFDNSFHETRNENRSENKNVKPGFTM